MSLFCTSVISSSQDQNKFSASKNSKFSKNIYRWPIGDICCDSKMIYGFLLPKVQQPNVQLSSLSSWKSGSSDLWIRNTCRGNILLWFTRFNQFRLSSARAATVCPIKTSNSYHYLTSLGDGRGDVAKWSDFQFKTRISVRPIDQSAIVQRHTADLLLASNLLSIWIQINIFLLLFSIRIAHVEPAHRCT